MHSVITIHHSFCSLTDASVGFSEPTVTAGENIGIYSTQLIVAAPPGVMIDVGFSLSVNYSNGTAVGKHFTLMVIVVLPVVGSISVKLPCSIEYWHELYYL